VVVDLDIATLAQRPELAALTNAFPGAWPAFMYEDLSADQAPGKALV